MGNSYLKIYENKLEEIESFSFGNNVRGHITGIETIGSIEVQKECKKHDTLSKKE